MLKSVSIILVLALGLSILAPTAMADNPSNPVTATVVVSQTQNAVGAPFKVGDKIKVALLLKAFGHCSAGDLMLIGADGRPSKNGHCFKKKLK